MTNSCPTKVLGDTLLQVDSHLIGSTLDSDPVRVLVSWFSPARPPAHQLSSHRLPGSPLTGELPLVINMPNIMSGDMFDQG